MAEEVRRSGRDVTIVAVHNVARVESLVDPLIVVPGAGTEIGNLIQSLSVHSLSCILVSNTTRRE
jgi:ribosomal protein L18E